MTFLQIDYKFLCPKNIIRYCDHVLQLNHEKLQVKLYSDIVYSSHVALEIQKL